MDGLRCTVWRTVLASAGMEQIENNNPLLAPQVTLLFPPEKMANLLIGDPFRGIQNQKKKDRIELVLSNHAGLVEKNRRKKSATKTFYLLTSRPCG
jgi:hypothetical protein